MIPIEKSFFTTYVTGTYLETNLELIQLKMLQKTGQFAKGRQFFPVSSLMQPYIKFFGTLYDTLK